MRCVVTTRISMPRSSSPQPERGTAAEPIPLFDRARPSLRRDLRAARAARAGSLKAGRRPPPEAARSGLDRREHAALIASDRNRIFPLDQQQSIFETAAFAASSGWRISILALMTAIPKCPSGGLTCFQRREEEKQKILADRHGII